MGPPSQHWTGFAGLDTESEKFKLIQQIFSAAKFDYLAAQAVEARRRTLPDLPSDVVCHVNRTLFAAGFQNVVLELAFSDGQYWVARVPYRKFKKWERQSLLSEIATMKIVSEKTAVPVAQVFAFNLCTTPEDQPFGYPYVLMECLPGSSLPGPLPLVVPEEHHAKVALQLATCLFDLSRLTYSRIGRLWCGPQADQSPEIIGMAWHAKPGPLATSLEYFYNHRQDQNREVVAAHPDDPDWRTACWVLKSSLTHIALGDRVHGPFPLCHLDLHRGNMMFDDEYNLTGIIDWANAQAAPLEQLSVCMELMTFPAKKPEENAPIVNFKRLVVSYLSKLEQERKEEIPADSKDITSLSTYLASSSAEIVLRQYIATPRNSLAVGKRVAKLIYGEAVSWEQLREVYGGKTLF
ncbi:hypothetical protein F503_04872 [Ophiostoma piceae UAMH 11346]|uniref:Aminoglycoside phosphotransferase domain-containing protein n=1 Tax=Ophiostoma piceae (strain UAMH 11346) TaxID=1262450 RepID=S3BRV2_OPHP1|nr:hypothetical protein F503_04872 [Ophiostoma piceae UAMH 11346]